MSKILLPKKEVPGQTLQSAQRVNAAAVLEAADIPLSPQAAPIPAAPAPQKPAYDIPALETYKSDIEGAVKDKNFTLADIAMAQARRDTSHEARAALVQVAQNRTRIFMNIAMVVGGILIILAAIGIVGAVWYFRSAPIGPAAPISLTTPFISVDETKPLEVPSDETHNALITQLETGRENTSVALGLISRILLMHEATSSETAALPITSQEFFALAAPGAPDSLARAVQPNFLLGIHAFDGNQPFLIFKTNSYEQVFAGMLQWEAVMQSDLSPLFDRTQRQHIPEEHVGTTTAPAAFIQGTFSDRVVENHDARVIQNATGDILLLWTFIDRNTLVITTDVGTLHEVIARLTQAPVVPVPGQ